MNLLMITRKVDQSDDLAGFTYGWVKKLGLELQVFQPKADPPLAGKLFVICLGKGDISDLPENVEIYSLGKEVGVSRFGRFIEFQKLAMKLVPQCFGIFCHMNPEYTINIWPYAKFYKKKIISWYTHKEVTWKVKLLEKAADIILTASGESFRVPSRKVIITGHGIDINLFKPIPKTPERKRDTFSLLTIGRISPTKDLESLIKAVYYLKGQHFNNIHVKIVGEPGLLSQYSYYEGLKQMARSMELEDIIEFVGPIPNMETVDFYQDADIFINLSGTGSVDKAVLEAMACGCLIITSNTAFSDMLDEKFRVSQNNPKELALKIFQLLNLPKDQQDLYKTKLRNKVVSDHNLENLTKQIIKLFYGFVNK